VMISRELRRLGTGQLWPQPQTCAGPRPAAADD